MEEKQNIDKLVAMQMTPTTKPHLLFHCWVHENRVFAMEVSLPIGTPSSVPSFPEVGWPGWTQAHSGMVQENCL